MHIHLLMILSWQLALLPLLVNTANAPGQELSCALKHQSAAVHLISRQLLQRLMQPAQPPPAALVGLAARLRGTVSAMLQTSAPVSLEGMPASRDQLSLTQAMIMQHVGHSLVLGKSKGGIF
jgi:hypothetical protein